MSFDASTLSRLRRFVAQHAADAGLSATAVDDMVLAVSELAANSVLHGGGAGRLWAWRTDTDLLFEVRDAGRIEDPFTERQRKPPPDLELAGGRGLWLVNQLCDLVQIRSSADGTAVRVHRQRS